MNSEVMRHSEALLIAWRLAELEAAHLRQAELEPPHFFLGLLKLVELEVSAILADNTTLSTERIQDGVAQVERLRDAFASADVDTTTTRRRLRRSLPKGETAVEARQNIRRSADTREMFSRAEQAIQHGLKPVLEPLHLLEAVIAAEHPLILQTLDLVGVGAGRLAATVAVFLSGGDSELEKPAIRKESRKTALAPAEKQGAKGLADRLGRDLTELAKRGALAPVIGRKNEMRSLVQTLLRSRKNNAILIGEAGVGKTGIVEGLAQRIVESAVPPEFADKRIVEISMGSLVAGTNLRGDMEERLQALIAQAKRDERLILFIDEIHLIVGSGAGSGSAMDAANLLKPALARGEICVIGATTTQEYRKFIECDSALARRFEVIEVLEPSPEEAVEILSGLQNQMEEHHGVRITESAIRASVDLTVRFLPERRLPDKAIDILDQACVQSRLQTLTGDFRSQVHRALMIEKKQVADAVAHRCKVPVGDIVSNDADRLLRLEEELGRRIKGQPQALAKVSQSLRLAKSGLGAAGRPMAVLLFAGPSGTGKTELAKVLADCFFGGIDRGFIRIDMSELMDAHSVSKLIGSPPGFIGHDQGGQLTDAVRSKPYAVLLLDEMEKAHPQIFDIFLQVFDNGFLMDARGNRCDFRNLVIIMTTNLVLGKSQRAVGFHQSTGPLDACSSSATTALGDVFRPEFLNRMSGIVHFDPLGVAALREIVDNLILRLNTKLASKAIRIAVSESAIHWLSTNGFDERYGARYLERVFESAIAEPVALILLKGTLKENTSIVVDLIHDQIEIHCEDADE